MPEPLADELAGQLGSESLGVESLPAGPGRSLLKIYLSTTGGTSGVLGWATRLLRANGLDVHGCRPRFEPVEDARWVERYQAQLKPFPLGEGFLVFPGSEPAGQSKRLPIRLVPSRAFGTGEHPTTQLCVAALERWVRRGSRWLDLGAGSGILSVVALYRGASRAVALDIDPEAVEVAREVLRANGLTDRAQLAVGSADILEPGVVDGVVANITSSYFLGHADAVAAVLTYGGILVACGFLLEERRKVEEALKQAGLSAVESC